MLGAGLLASWGAGLLGCGHAVSFLAPSTPPASARADEFAALENMLLDFPCALLSYSRLQHGLQPPSRSSSGHSRPCQHC